MSSICYLLDENMDPNVRTQLIRKEPDLVAWVVGDPGVPKKGTLDPDILLWCEEQDFILVTNNRRSMPVHLRDHLATGRHIPGIFVLRRHITKRVLIEQLLLIPGKD